MPINYSQSVIEDAFGTMTGWRGSDGESRYSYLAEGVEVDPFIWELWVALAARPDYDDHYFQIGGIVASVTPNSGGNNLPRFELRWDSDGVWRQTFTIQSGSGISSNLAANTRPDDPSTMSFRVANTNDFIGGIFTPRSFSGLDLSLVATQIDPVVNLYSSVTLGLSLGAGALTPGSGLALGSGARSYVVIVG